jgi:5-oxopent-3-ene-1,2,5-tricarboxylate decarboxylase/2-hydroxyhepta-2,4-diene-1,7-dioate isomerase
VKNRDGCTPLGPWLTDRDDIANPMALALTTRVNGVTTQTGSTADMIFDISTLIAYLSSFMTLNPGDVILTGTPEGLADVKAGDVVETEIEGLGCLVNRIVDDQTFFAQG